MGGGFDRALRAMRLREYCRNPAKMTVKQRQALKRDVLRRCKDILHMRETAEVGDIVRVPRLVPSPLPGGYKRDGARLVEAEVIDKRYIASSWRYRVKRIADGELQEGNGHMIKAIIRKRGGIR